MQIKRLKAFSFNRLKFSYYTADVFVDSEVFHCREASHYGIKFALNCKLKITNISRLKELYDYIYFLLADFSAHEPEIYMV